MIKPRLDWSKTWDSLFEPLGLICISQVAKSLGNEVIILDQAQKENRTSSGLLLSLKKIKPHLIGITSTTHEFPHALNIARQIKSWNHEIPIVFGGYHVSGNKEVLAEDSVDMVIRGEGEEPFKSLLQGLGDEKKMRQINGLSFKTKQEIIHNPPQPRIKSLESFGIPYRDDMNPSPYHWLGIADVWPFGQNFFTVQSARGCRKKCVFCQTPVIRGTELILRPVSQVLDEIQLLYTKYKANLIAFIDEDFSAFPERIMEICDGLLTRNIKIPWCSTVSAENVTSALAKNMRKAGCCFVNLGIETGSDEGLKKINKQTSISRIKTTAKYLMDADIQILGTAIIGFPWETEVDLNRNLDFFRTLPVDILGLSFCIPFNGTPIRKIADSENLIFDFNLSHWTGDFPVMKTRFLDEGRLKYFFRKIQRDFYLGIGFRTKIFRLFWKKPFRIFSLGTSICISTFHGGIKTRFFP